MAELLRANNPSIISVIEGLLGGADIPSQVTDRNMLPEPDAELGPSGSTSAAAAAPAVQELEEPLPQAELRERAVRMVAEIRPDYSS